MTLEGRGFAFKIHSDVIVFLVQTGTKSAKYCALKQSIDINNMNIVIQKENLSPLLSISEQYIKRGDSHGSIMNSMSS